MSDHDKTIPVDEAALRRHFEDLSETKRVVGERLGAVARLVSRGHKALSRRIRSERTASDPAAKPGMFETFRWHRDIFMTIEDERGGVSGSEGYAYECGFTKALEVIDEFIDEGGPTVDQISQRIEFLLREIEGK